MCQPVLWCHQLPLTFRLAHAVFCQQLVGSAVMTVIGTLYHTCVKHTCPCRHQRVTCRMHRDIDRELCYIFNDQSGQSRLVATSYCPILPPYACILFHACMPRRLRQSNTARLVSVDEPHKQFAFTAGMQCVAHLQQGAQQ